MPSGRLSGELQWVAGANALPHEPSNRRAAIIQSSNGGWATTRGRFGGPLSSPCSTRSRQGEHAQRVPPSPSRSPPSAPYCTRSAQPGSRRHPPSAAFHCRRAPNLTQLMTQSSISMGNQTFAPISARPRIRGGPMRGEKREYQSTNQDARFPTHSAGRAPRQRSNRLARLRRGARPAWMRCALPVLCKSLRARPDRHLCAQELPSPPKGR